MPVFETFTINSSKIGIWKINETIDEFWHLAENLLTVDEKLNVESFTSISRKKEFIAVRLIANILNQNLPLKINYDKFGKPSADSIFIGISHTENFAAVVLNKDKQVSIDIEKYSEKAQKIAKKFLSEIEIKEFDISEPKFATLLWSVKETVFKYYAKKNLPFATQINILPAEIKQNGTLKVILKQQTELEVNYKFYQEFVLSFI